MKCEMLDGRMEKHKFPTDCKPSLQDGMYSRLSVNLEL